MELNILFLLAIIAIFVMLILIFQKNKKIANQQELIISQKEQIAELNAKCNQQINQLKLENEIIDIVKDQFSKIAVETIKKEQNDLITNNQSAVSLTLKPFSEKLDIFKREITEYKNKHDDNTSALSQKIEDLQKRSVELDATAKNLTNALTKNKNVKGWYGEDLAKTILEKSGFVEGVHYSAQNREETDTDKKDNKTVIPDYEIFLPDNRNLVIDAKAILSSIVNLQETDDKELAQKNIFEAVKTRIDELSSKKYQNIKGLRQPEFVIMYIPIEPIVNLLYTTSKGSELINYSRKNNIVITGSVSLITIINLIDWLWKENDRIKNFDKIIDTGTKLYEAISNHASDILKIQDSINNAKNTVDVTISKLSDSKSKYNIFRQAQKLKEFGITSSKSIPDDLIKEND